MAQITRYTTFFNDGQVRAGYRYNDQNMEINRVAAINESMRPLHIWVRIPETGQIYETTVPGGQTVSTNIASMGMKVTIVTDDEGNEKVRVPFDYRVTWPAD